MSESSHSAPEIGISINEGIPSGVMQVSGEMVLLTWVSFAIAAVLLFRMTWKPILRTLDKREKDIKSSLDGAEKAREEAARSEERSRRIVADAAEKAKALAEDTRRAAERAAAAIEAEAREQARRLVEQAGRDIEAAKQRAMADLRRESARLAVDLTGRLLREDIPEDRRQAYTERMVKDFQA